MGKIDITVQMTNGGSKFKVQCLLTSTVLQLKTEITSRIDNTQPGDLILIFSGKELSNTNITL